MEFNTDGRSAMKALKENLPELNEFLRYELSLCYPQCIKINNSQNYLRAFAVALQEQLVLRSNSHYFKNLIQQTRNRGTFTNFTLAASIDIDKGVSVTELIEIFSVILQRYKAINQGIAIFEPHEFKPLGLLCKVFGVCACFIYNSPQDLDHYTKKKLNAAVEDFHPTLHFLARSADNSYKIEVLVTYLHLHEVLTANEDVEIVIQLKQNNEIPKENSDFFLKYLLKVSEINDKCLNAISKSIDQNKPVEIDTEEYDNLKREAISLRGSNGLARQESEYAMDEPRSLRDNLIVSQQCRDCSMHTEEEIFPIQCSCWYHESCLINRFRSWYDKCDGNRTIDQQGFDCRCGKRIKLKYFLEIKAGINFKDICLMQFDKKFLCGHCGASKSVDKIVSIEHNRGCQKNLCYDCCFFSYKDKKRHFRCICQGGLTLADDTVFPCSVCGIQTHMQNFLVTVQKGESIACKNCWFQFVYFKTGRLIWLGDINEKMNYFESDKITCSLGCKNNYRLYQDVQCSYGCPICYEHQLELNALCSACGQGTFISKVHQW